MQILKRGKYMDYECQECLIIFNEEDIENKEDPRCPYCYSENIEKIRRDNVFYSKK